MLRNFLRLGFREEHEDGRDLGGNIEIEDTQDKDAQKIIDRINGKEDEVDDEVKLPSDEKNDGEKLFADKYKSVDDLKKGIAGLKSTLPQYIIDGMSDEALEQHYVELRKEFSGKKDDKANDNKGRKFEEKQEEDKKEDETDVVKEKDPKLWSDLETEFNTKGSITSEQYDKLEDMGIPPEIVDKYLDGLNTDKINFTNQVMEIAGGEDGYAEIKAWAEDGNVEPALMDAMQTMSYEQILPIYKGIKAQYDLSNKKATRITGETSVKSGQGYVNQEDYMKDVADRRYGQNRAFTEAVDKKFSQSKFK